MSEGYEIRMPKSPGTRIVTKYKVIERYSFALETISYSTQAELCNKLNAINGEILSINVCTPEATDTKCWIRVYYKYNC